RRAAAHRFREAPQGAHGHAQEGGRQGTAAAIFGARRQIPGGLIRCLAPANAVARLFHLNPFSQGVMSVRKSLRWNVKSAAAAVMLGLSAWGSAWAGPLAVFDATTQTLTLPELRLNANTKVSSVVVRFLDFGQVRVNDPSVGAHIEFVAEANVLRIPALSLGGVEYPAV